MTTQVNREVVALVNPILGTAVIRVREFTRMNPLEFHGLKVCEDPQEFVYEIYKIVEIMEVSIVEKAELSAYQLKGVAQVWFNQWKEERAIGAIPLDWEKFKGVFLDFFSS
ncbi:hypothetical protein MTR67_022633 [Solanum verrucosum]|uniref:Gag-pol polyprotein n=1 Tax=Solanum verrucosum TaxID=315347 RepID=A0AAF0QTU4_SOLVR|nr:hypothetical protein MTR67_022633 [Solanum verrucosum]